MSTRKVTAGMVLTLLASLQISAVPLMGSLLTEWSCPHPESELKRLPEPALPIPIPIPEPTESVSKDQVLATAYYDTMRILNRGNQCSNFYGGPAASVEVFREFISGIKRSFMSPRIGLRMSGDYMNVLNAETKLKYRLFENASLNLDGPFYKRSVPPSSAGTSVVGSFASNTREARVLMLLHELGHLMKGPTGNWLLPDDGNNLADSLKNTRRIESICGEQIRALGSHETATELARNKSEQTVSPAAATSSQH
jgi:hypothetical protein